MARNDIRLVVKLCSAAGHLMAKKSKIAKDEQRRKLVTRYAELPGFSKAIW